MFLYLKKAALQLFRRLIIIGICAFVGILLLAGSYLVPSRLIYENVNKSAITLYEEEIGRYVWEDSPETILDNHTDGLILNEAITFAQDGISDILLNPHIRAGGMSAATSLYEVVVLANDDYRTEYYGRYWHGYLAVIRPLLMFFNYTQIRHLLMTLQIFLVFVYVWMTARADALNALIPFAGLWLFLSPITLFGSLQYAPCFLVTMLMLIVLFGWKDKIDNSRRNDLFLLAGIATAYFDLLTYPLVTLGVPLLFYLATDRECLFSAKKAFRNVAALSFSWGGGYAVMWGLKWILASMFTEENIIADAVDRILLRSGQLSENMPYGKVLKYATQNMDMNRVFWIFLTLAVLSVCIRIKRHRMIRKETLPSLGIMLLVSLYPFAWYFVAAEHSMHHSHFVWREMGISVYGILMIGEMVLGLLPGDYDKPPES